MDEVKMGHNGVDAVNEVNVTRYTWTEQLSELSKWWSDIEENNNGVDAVNVVNLANGQRTCMSRLISKRIEWCERGERSVGVNKANKSSGWSKLYEWRLCQWSVKWIKWMKWNRSGHVVTAVNEENSVTSISRSWLHSLTFSSVLIYLHYLYYFIHIISICSFNSIQYFIHIVYSIHFINSEWRVWEWSIKVNQTNEVKKK